MLQTYKAILDDNRVEWLERPPEQSGAVQVHITILEEPLSKPISVRGRMMADALSELAQRGTLAAGLDPAAWQREVRTDRALPDRNA